MATATLAVQPALSARRRWTVLAVCALSMFLVGLDTTIVNVGLPAIGRGLGAGTRSLEWIVDANVGPEQSAIQGEQHDEIQSYLQVLPSKYRAVIVLRYWYDFSYEEIARTLDLTPALVKARLHRARELLARYMKQLSSNQEEQIDALQRS